MGNFLGRLEPESKVFRSCTIPAFNRFAVRNSIEGIVDLAGRKSLRVERQHLRGRKFLRIKGSAPFGILEPGSADPKGHCAGYSRQQRESRAPGGRPLRRRGEAVWISAHRGCEGPQPSRPAPKPMGHCRAIPLSPPATGPLFMLRLNGLSAEHAVNCFDSGFSSRSSFPTIPE